MIHSESDVPDDESDDLPEESSGDGDEAATTLRSNADIVLPGSEALTTAQVDEFLQRRDAVFVAFIGDRGCGKTTLICEIYEQFRKGPFAGLIFAGSSTLHALEKRVHPSRVASGLPKSATIRTSVAEGLRFLHLAYENSKRRGDRKDLLLSDRAGETYKAARGDSKKIAALVEIARADFVVFMLDGARVVDARERSATFLGVKQTVLALLDAGALTGTSRVQIVTTKLDLILKLPEVDGATLKALLGRTLDQWKRDFSGRVASLEFLEIAARPDEAPYETFGLDIMLKRWDDVPKRQPLQSPATFAEPQTQFDKLLSRTKIEESA